MALFKVNPALRVSWLDGQTVLQVPGLPGRILNDSSGLALLADFARPRQVAEVLEEYEDPATAEEAIGEFYRSGALIHAADDVPLPPDLLREAGAFREIHERVAPFAMGTPALTYALYTAVTYVVRHGIQGDIVEAGVWKGGSAMVCALTLLALGITDRNIVLYDTFDGTWPEPTEADGTIYGRTVEDTLGQHGGAAGRRPSAAELEQQGLGQLAVRKTLEATGYPRDRIILVAGPVEETIPSTVPDRIALLRLDTDFHRSTLHELTHLYPRLERGGILLVDDYPTELGATKAVDDYFNEPGRRIFLGRIDVQGRIGVKQ